MQSQGWHKEKESRMCHAILVGGRGLAVISMPPVVTGWNKDIPQNTDYLRRDVCGKWWLCEH